MGPAPPSRLIPARAGKTRGGSPTATVSTAHPRACGENDTGGGASLIAPGSSPRVRGKRARGPPQGPLAGLIPARAGKTWSAGGPATRWRAHPRACGENLVCRRTSHTLAGSSPRVRGKPSGRSPGGRPPRLIPARAGKTRRWPSGRPGSSAHPRACGENGRRLSLVGPPLGSSPRVRGKLAYVIGRDPHPGLIPARAGKTPAGRRSGRASRAHPRACGENAIRDLLAVRALGSSPRVRGKPGAHIRTRHRPRLIPARAGKTAPPSGVASISRGSSPRVRGKRPFGPGSVQVPRLIPARAGKTPRNWT